MSRIACAPARALLLVSALAATAACSAEPRLATPASVTDKRASRAVAMTPGDATDEDALRAAPPAPLSPRRIPHGTLRDETLPSGVRVVTLERHDFPAVSCAFVLDRGAAAVPAGAARVYAAALVGSSRSFARDDALSYLRFVGATLRPRAAQDGVVLQVTALSPLAVSALSRAAPMFLAPSLDDDDVERARVLVAADRSADGDAPARRAKEALFAALFPPPHPYGAPIDGGGADALRRVAPDTVAALRDLHLSPTHVAIACAGDLQHDRLVRVLAAHVAALRPKPERPLPDRAAPRPGPARVVVVDRPGAAQSNVALGWLGPRASDRDALALDVLSAATAAGLSSRLNLSVRKELGATYGVHMRLVRMREAGAITVRAAIETARTGPALRAILDGIDALRAAPLGPEELASAKLRVGFEDEGGSIAGVASALADAIILGRPAADALGEQAHIDALDAETVRAAAARWLTREGARLVVVGDAAKIAKDLGPLGLGEVDVVRPD